MEGLRLLAVVKVTQAETVVSEEGRKRWSWRVKLFPVMSGDNALVCLLDLSPKRFVYYMYLAVYKYYLLLHN